MRRSLAPAAAYGIVSSLFVCLHAERTIDKCLTHRWRDRSLESDHCGCEGCGVHGRAELASASEEMTPDTKLGFWGLTPKAK